MTATGTLCFRGGAFDLTGLPAAKQKKLARQIVDAVNAAWNNRAGEGEENGQEEEI